MATEITNSDVLRVVLEVATPADIAEAYALAMKGRKMAMEQMGEDTWWGTWCCVAQDLNLSAAERQESVMIRLAYYLLGTWADQDRAAYDAGQRYVEGMCPFLETAFVVSVEPNRATLYRVKLEEPWLFDPITREETFPNLQAALDALEARGVRDAKVESHLSERYSHDGSLWGEHCEEEQEEPLPDWVATGLAVDGSPIPESVLAFERACRGLA